MYQPLSAIQIDPGLLQKLFWKRRVLKIDDTGLITLQIMNERYGFQLYDKLFIAHKNTRVIVRYDNEKLNEIFIYDFNNDNFISAVKQSLFWTRDNPEAFYKHIGKVKKTVKMIKESKIEDELLLADEIKSPGHINRLLTNKLISI